MGPRMVSRMGPRTAGTAIGSYISLLRPEGAYLDPETVVRWIPCGPPYGSWDSVWAPVWSPVWAPVPKGSLRDSSGLPYVLVSSGLPYVLVRTGLPYVLGSSCGPYVLAGSLCVCVRGCMC